MPPIYLPSLTYTPPLTFLYTPYILLSCCCPGNSVVTQNSDTGAISSGTGTPAVLGQDLDSLLGSAPAAAAPAPQQYNDVDDLNLDDLLGPGANSAPPQRFSGGGRAGVTSSIPAARAPPAASGQRWDSPPPSSSYSGEFGATSGKYGDSAAAAAGKVLKGDQQVSMVEVGDDGACPVEEKDVDPQTMAALKARGIENFTPVQVGSKRVVAKQCWYNKLHQGTSAAGDRCVFSCPLYVVTSMRDLRTQLVYDACLFKHKV